MMRLHLSRRAFTSAATLSAFAGLSACTTGRGAGNGPGYGAPVPDPAGLIDLPPGFSYRILSSLGEPMDDGDTVPDRADGMGCFSGPNGTVILVRNHELGLRDGPTAGFGPGAANAPAFARDASGTALPGGTTTLHVDPRSGWVLRQFRSLYGTVRNCAGGITPWRSWLTCEEDITRAGPTSDRDHGWLFEVPADATGPVTPVPLTAMGRFNHEAVVIDPATGIAYLTEDRNEGLLYRFIPTRPGQLAQGGRLQALAVPMADTRNWAAADMAPGQPVRARWIDLDGVEAPEDDLRQRGAALGAALFARGEGIWFGRNELFFCCTNGGPARLGQIFRLDIGRRGQADRLSLFLESANTDTLNFGDNLTIMPNGALMVCEDQYTDTVDNHLRIVGTDGAASMFARIRVQTEPAGVCFSPSGRHMFVNIYSPTKTLMITGPW